MSSLNEIKLLDRIIISLPFISAVWFYSLVIFYRVQHGFWPYYNSINTSNIQGWQFAFDLGAGLALVVTLVSPIIVLPVQLARAYFFKRNVKVPTLIYISVWLIWLASIYLDPGKFYDWYFD